MVVVTIVNTQTTFYHNQVAFLVGKNFQGMSHDALMGCVLIVTEAPDGVA